MEQNESLNGIKGRKGNEVICSICKSNVSIYCCPRCGTRTCSLDCCTSHKKISECNGKRDRTAYVSKENFRDNSKNLISDYHFLEDALLVNRRAKRFLSDHTSAKRKKSKKPIPNGRRIVYVSDGNSRNSPNPSWFHDQFIKQQSDCSTAQKLLLCNAYDRSKIRVLFMPIGMDRHKRNKSYFHVKNDILLWTVEFLFYFPSESGTTQKAITLDRINDANRIVDEVNHARNKYNGIGNNKNNVTQNVSNMSMGELQLFVKIEPSASSSVRYQKLDPSLSFRDGLKDMNIIEYPTIHIAPNSCVSMFPTLVQDISL